MSVINRLVVEIAADVSDLKKGLDQASKEVESFGKTASATTELIREGSNYASNAVKDLVRGVSQISSGNNGNGAKQLASGLGNAAMAAKAAGLGLKSVLAILSKITIVIAVVITAIKAIKAIIDSAKLGLTLLSLTNAKVAKDINSINSSISRLRSQLLATFGTILADLVHVVAPILTKIIDGLTEIIELVGQLYAIVTFKDTYLVAVDDGVASLVNDLNKAVLAQKKLIEGFDEVKRLTPKDETTTNTKSTEEKELDRYAALKKLKDLFDAFLKYWVKIKKGTDDWFDNTKNKIAGLIPEVDRLMLPLKDVVNLVITIPGYQDLMNDLNELVRRLKELGQTSTEHAIDLVISAVPSIEQIKQSLLNLENLAITVTVGVVVSGLNDAKRIIDSALEGAKVLAEQTGKQISDAFDGVKTGLVSVVNTAKERANQYKTALTTAVSSALTSIKTDVASTTQSITLTIASGCNSAKQFVQDNATGAIAIITTTGALIVSNVVSTLTNARTSAQTNLVAILSSFTATVAAIGVALGIFNNDLTTAFSTVMESINTKVAEGFSNIRLKVNEFVTDTSSKIQTWASNTSSKLVSWGTSTVNTLNSWKTNAVSAVNQFKTSFVQAISSALESAMSKVTSWCSNALSKIQNVFSKLSSTSSYSGYSSYSSYSGSSSSSSYEDTTTKNKTTQQLNSTSSVWKQILNWASASTDDVNQAKQMIEKNKNSLSTKALEYLNAMVIPASASSMAVLYSMLKKLFPVSAFANGGVITQPTIGLVGEYASAGAGNPEIITPTNLMRQVVNDANNNLANVYISVGRLIIAAIEDKDFNVKIGDTEIARAAARGNKSYTRMTGESLFV